MMDVTNFSSSSEEVTDHPVLEPAALMSNEISSEFDGIAVSASEVTFRPGEHTTFHTHDGVQILYVTEGNGIVANREREEEVSEGDVILISRGEEHWHGNTQNAENAFSHVYFIAKYEGTEAEPLDSPE
jgi:quercetin dioxygenase-like cupin family protein